MTNESIAHKWIYVIIPYQVGERTPMRPLFCAYCKQCNTYFSELFPRPFRNIYQEQKSSLPLLGCKPDNPELNLF
jgi:hypothetical protein